MRAHSSQSSMATAASPLAPVGSAASWLQLPPAVWSQSDDVSDRGPSSSSSLFQQGPHLAAFACLPHAVPTAAIGVLIVSGLRSATRRRRRGDWRWWVTRQAGLRNAGFTDGLELEEDDNSLRWRRALTLEPRKDRKTRDIQPYADEEEEDDEEQLSMEWGWKRSEEGLVPMIPARVKPLVRPRNHWALWPGMQDSFETLAGIPVPRRLARALRERGFDAPSPIQDIAIPRIARGECSLLHAPTGSGKTLAYLLPILARLQPKTQIGAQVIILVPGPELALQIVREARWLFQVCCDQGTCWYNPQVPWDHGVEVVLTPLGLWEVMRQDTAIVVTTAKLIQGEINQLRKYGRRFAEAMSAWMGVNLDTVVLDEVDAQFNKGRAKRTSLTETVLDTLFYNLRVGYCNRDVLLVSASASANQDKVKKAMERILLRKYAKRSLARRRRLPAVISTQLAPDGRTMSATWGAGALLPDTITHALYMMPESSDDSVQLAHFGWARLRTTLAIVSKLDGLVVVVVPHEIETSAVVALLKEGGVQGVAEYSHKVGMNPTEEERELAEQRPLHTRTQRREKMEEVISSGDELLKDVMIGKVRVVVIQEVTVRGVDLIGVDYVVNMKLPYDIADYAHKVGRTGRMGREGTAITLITPEENLSPLLDKMQKTFNTSFMVWDLDKATTAGKRKPPIIEETIHELELEGAELRRQKNRSLRMLKRHRFIPDPDAQEPSALFDWRPDGEAGIDSLRQLIGREEKPLKELDGGEDQPLRQLVGGEEK